MTKFDGVIFDLDYTLYDEQEYFFTVFREFCTLFQCPERLGFMEDSFISLRTMSKDIFEDVLQSSGFKNVLSQYKDELFRLYTTTNARIRPYEDALTLLGILKIKQLQTGILTNGVVLAQKNKLRCLSIDQYFDIIFFARQLGREFEKPHIKSFEGIARAVNISASRLLFIGDNPNTDFQGAKAIGGSTVRLQRGIFKDIPSNDFIDYQVGSLMEIEKLL